MLQVLWCEQIVHGVFMQVQAGPRVLHDWTVCRATALKPDDCSARSREHGDVCT